MRGADVTQEGLFTFKRLNDFVPADHPLRPMREILNGALKSLDPLFEKMYAREGRESIPPERLLRALVLQALYSIRSERQLCEQLSYNLLYRWFVGLSMEDKPWDHSSFSANRERLIEHEAVRELFGQVLEQAQAKKLLSAEHFSVDGTLSRAWASQKSFVPKDGPKPPRGGSRSNPEVDFRGTRRSRDTHESASDPEALLYKKSDKAEAVPAYLGHVLMENRNGLAVDVRLTQAEGTAEREAALQMLSSKAEARRITVGADKHYDQAGFVDVCRSMGVTPHVAQNTTNRRSCIDARTTRHPGYSLSQTIRKLIETHFADGKQHGTLRQVKLRGLERVAEVFTLNVLASNLRRMAKLFSEPLAPMTG